MKWEMIFKLSKVNGALYLGDTLPPQNWKWPKNTWLQERLRDLRNAEQQLDRRNVGNGLTRRWPGVPVSKFNEYRF
ncbi:MAG: hypothetical protein ACREQP_00315 [Candidatus Binatia bacterium]